MARTPYSAGTASVANGETTVTITGGVLTSLNCREGYDVIIEGHANYVASRTNTTTFELVMPHGGAGGSGLSYAIRSITAEEIATATLNGRAAELIERLDGGLILGASLVSFRLSVADDDVATVDLTEVGANPDAYNTIWLNSLDDPTEVGFFVARPSSSPHCDGTGIGTFSDIDFTTGALNGTTGSDGKKTISAHTDGLIYVENRDGATRSFRMTLLGV